MNFSGSRHPVGSFITDLRIFFLIFLSYFVVSYDRVFLSRSLPFFYVAKYGKDLLFTSCTVCCYPFFNFSSVGFTPGFCVRLCEACTQLGSLAASACLPPVPGQRGVGLGRAADAADGGAAGGGPARRGARGVGVAGAAGRLQPAVGVCGQCAGTERVWATGTTVWEEGFVGQGDGVPK